MDGASAFPRRAVSHPDPVPNGDPPRIDGHFAAPTGGRVTRDGDAFRFDIS